VPFQGHDLLCSWASVDFDNQDPPTKFCLGGKESWGTCKNGMFLCQTDTLEENILKCKTLKQTGGQTQEDWVVRDCNVLAARVLKPGAAMLLDQLEKAPGGFDKAEATMQATRSESRNKNTSLEEMQVVTVSVGSSPQDSFDSFMMCAAYATKLAFGDQTFFLHNNMFRFSEKPRSLLNFLRKDLKLNDIHWCGSRMHLILL